MLTRVLRELGIEAPSDLDLAQLDIATVLPIDLGLPIASAPNLQAPRKADPALSIFRQGEARPRLVVTSAKVSQPNRVTLNVDINGGTVWIAARALDASWPDDAYVGFTASKGTIRITSKDEQKKPGNQITYPADAEIVLDVIPAKVIATGTKCPAQPSVAGPDHVHIEWKPGKPPAFKIGPASATFAGQMISLSATSQKPHLEPDLAAIVFRAALKPATWDTSQLASALVTFSGTTKLTGGWTLSVVKAPGGILAEALNPGFFLFSCKDPLHAKWGGGEGEFSLPNASIAVREGQFILLQRGGAAEPLTRTLRIWAVREEEDAPRLPLTLRFGGAGSVFAYVCDAENGESLLASCSAIVKLDRPVTIHGRPLELSETNEAWLAVEKKNGTTRVRVGALDRDAARNASVILALRNALVPSSQPLLVFLDGTLGEGGLVDQGKLSLALIASGWAPTLPDPYVTSRLLPKTSGDPKTVQFPTSTRTLLIATVAWTAPPLPKVSFFGSLGSAVGAAAPQTADPTRPMQQPKSQIRVPTQTAQGAELPQGFHVQAAQSIAARAATTPPPRGLRLLDVSTNKDLLGVEVMALARQAAHYAVRGLDVCTPATALRVFALPQVQWEPVRTLDRDQDVNLGHFPTPLASVTDGGATTLAVASQQLAPAIPDLAMDVFLDEFEAGRAAHLVTTLPFGIAAMLELRPTDTPGPNKRKRDAIRRNEPEFLQPALRGGAQLAFIAESGPSGRRQSSHFDGWARQMTNGVSLATGAPLLISVLGSAIDPDDSVEAMFNNEFGPSVTTARVPVTRLDVSGYGGSCFSEWLNQDAAFADAARVQFQVLVGRTALEVVKFATVLYPWGVRLTRSVTIERKGGGGVIRRDTGWQPASDGLFQFPGTTYQVQPGLLRGLFAIRNIRSTGHEPIRFMGRGGRSVVLTPKFFDARVAIDGLEGPQLEGNGMLGFLQVEPRGEALHEDELEMLLKQQGPAGGLVDGIVNVGASGFRVRATRIEVGVGEDGGGRPELVGIVRSAPVFRQDGSWSAVRGPGPSNPHPDAEFENVSDLQGLPVVREGALTGIDGNKMKIGPQSDIRFCDPADLHKPNDPAFEYAILQTSPAHAFLFSRPHIVAGVHELRSRTVPYFADTIARSTSKGLFPPFANAIKLPKNTLDVNAAGGFKLKNPVNLNAPRPPLILAQSGSDVTQLDYGPAELSFNFEQTVWSADLRGIEIWSDILGLQKVLGTRMRVTGGTTTRPVVQEIHSLLMEPLQDVLTFLPGLGDRPQIGPIDLAATNGTGETAIEFSLSHDWQIPPGNVPGPKIEIGLGLAFNIGWGPPSQPDSALSLGSAISISFDAIIPIPATVVVIILGAAIEVGVGLTLEEEWAQTTTFDFKAYAGVGVRVPGFEASFTFGFHLVIEDSQHKRGIVVMIEAELNVFKCIVVGISGELGGLWYADDSHPPKTQACDSYGEVEVHVEIFFLTFNASREVEHTEYLD